MKKILLLLLSISFFATATYAQQEWEKIYAEGDVKIEMMTEDCNPNDRLVPNTYALLRFTNKSNKKISFKFTMDLWYNNKLDQYTPNDAGDPPVIKTIELAANSSVSGNCNSKEEYLKVFFQHNNPKVETKLTKIQFTAK